MFENPFLAVPPQSGWPRGRGCFSGVRLPHRPDSFPGAGAFGAGALSMTVILVVLAIVVLVVVAMLVQRELAHRRELRIRDNEYNTAVTLWNFALIIKQRIDEMAKT